MEWNRGFLGHLVNVYAEGSILLLFSKPANRGFGPRQHSLSVLVGGNNFRHSFWHKGIVLFLCMWAVI